MALDCRVRTVDLGFVNASFMLIIRMQSAKLALAVTLKPLVLLLGVLSHGVNVLSHLSRFGVEGNLLPHLLLLHG